MLRLRSLYTEQHSPVKRYSEERLEDQRTGVKDRCNESENIREKCCHRIEITGGTVEALFEKLGCSQISHSEMFNTYHLKINSKKSVKEMVEAYNADPRVKWAEPNAIFEQPKPIYEGGEGNE